MTCDSRLSNWLELKYTSLFRTSKLLSHEELKFQFALNWKDYIAPINVNFTVPCAHAIRKCWQRIQPILQTLSYVSKQEKAEFNGFNLRHLINIYIIFIYLTRISKSHKIRYLNTTKSLYFLNALVWITYHIRLKLRYLCFIFVPA